MRYKIYYVYTLARPTREIFYVWEGKGHQITYKGLDGINVIDWQAVKEVMPRNAQVCS